MNIITIICLILFLLCVLIPLNKNISRYHVPLAWILLIFSLIHGFTATKNGAMITGKIAWLILLIMIILTYAIKKKSPKWRKFHTSFSIIFSVLVIIHIIYGIII